MRVPKQEKQRDKRKNDKKPAPRGKCHAECFLPQVHVESLFSCQFDIASPLCLEDSFTASTD